MIKAIYKNKIDSINVNVIEKDKESKEIDIKDLFQKEWIFLYYYPAINTSVCSSEVKMVDSLKSKLSDMKVTAYGFSWDDEKTISKYVEKNNISHSIISDKKGELFEYFNVSGASKMCRQIVILNKKSELVYQQTSPAFAGRNFESIIEDIVSIKKAEKGIPTACKLDKK